MKQKQTSNLHWGIELITLIIFHRFGTKRKETITHTYKILQTRLVMVNLILFTYGVLMGHSPVCLLFLQQVLFCLLHHSDYQSRATDLQLRWGSGSSCSKRAWVAAAGSREVSGWVTCACCESSCATYCELVSDSLLLWVGLGTCQLCTESVNNSVRMRNCKFTSTEQFASDSHGTRLTAFVCRAATIVLGDQLLSRLTAVRNLRRCAWHLVAVDGQGVLVTFTDFTLMMPFLTRLVERKTDNRSDKAFLCNVHNVVVWSRAVTSLGFPSGPTQPEMPSQTMLHQFLWEIRHEQAKPCYCRMCTYHNWWHRCHGLDWIRWCLQDRSNPPFVNRGLLEWTFRCIWRQVVKHNTF